MGNRWMALKCRRSSVTRTTTRAERWEQCSPIVQRRIGMLLLVSFLRARLWNPWWCNTTESAHNIQLHPSSQHHHTYIYIYILYLPSQQRRQTIYKYSNTPQSGTNQIQY